MENKGHLHLHTGASDGLITIEDIANSKISFTAITDHDTMDSIEKFKVLERYGIEIIPGIELSARHMGKNIHLLVYYPEYKPEFTEMLSSFRERRTNRGLRTAEKLNSLGLRISIEEMTRGNIVTKGTIANSVFSYLENRELLEKQGITNKDTFIKTYLDDNGPASVELSGNEIKYLFSMVDGVKVLAHPGHNLDMGAHDCIIEDLAKNHGLWGIEVWARKHDEEEEEHYYSLAKKLGLYPTMSNDVHFSHQIEKNAAPCYMLEAIRKERK
ncbi:MAG: PHP domain-containing protein [Nanoarchaeota archaeon]